VIDGLPPKLTGTSPLATDAAFPAIPTCIEPIVTGAVPYKFERWIRAVPRLPTVGLTMVRKVCSLLAGFDADCLLLFIAWPHAVTHTARALTTAESGVPLDVEHALRSDVRKMAKSPRARAPRLVTIKGSPLLQVN
jgi:hypothetical protein